ncbi:MAG: transposase [Xenococcaceae cyanobacterium MO_234.B1]|nr:transposase [Xenococcaceae cyanobacterium MO_234.B1]
MKQAFQYKLLLNTNQRQEIDRWLDMLRHQYNYLLAERYSWWKYNRSDCVIPQGEFCQIACTIGSQVLRNNPDWHSQSAKLPQLKKERPWYKDIYSQVLQDCVKRVKLAFDRYVKGDNKGKRSGKPRFKNKNRYRTLTYPQAKDNWIIGNKIKLPKLGLIKYICHRPIPQGFKIKTASITKKADGYYLTLITEDQTVPEFKPDIVPTEDNSLAIDLGLEKLYFDSNGNFVLPQKHLRKAESKMAKLQRKLADNSRSKKAKKLIRRAIARFHQKITRARQQWHYEEAKKLSLQAQVIFIEDLKIANLRRKNKLKNIDGKYIENGQCRKAGLNKSFSDCAIAQFVEILQHQAQKLGTKIIKVNPRNTSQVCWNCLNKVPKSLSDRWHQCDNCNESIDRDFNSSLLIKKLGLGVVSV